MILALKTDSPEAYIGLYDDDGQLAGHDTWRADRTLARDLLAHIDALLGSHECSWDDIRGIIVFEGPGSFTGLRIGLMVANTIAYARSCPIVGSRGDDWLDKGLTRLRRRENDHSVMPEYGAQPRITQPKR